VFDKNSPGIMHEAPCYNAYIT